MLPQLPIASHCRFSLSYPRVLPHTHATPADRSSGGFFHTDIAISAVGLYKVAAARSLVGGQSPGGGGRQAGHRRNLRQARIGINSESGDRPVLLRKYVKIVAT